MYEQAMELARSFTPGTDFTVDEVEGVRLAEGAAGLLGRLVTPLGGVWAARERREQLVALALEALHLRQPEVDYRVADGRILMPEKPAERAEEEAARDAVLQALLEVKEGCRSSARREVLARTSVPAFLGRYLHLGGACSDARGLERELWTLYQLKCAHARGGGRRAREVPARVFATRAAKHAVIAEAAREAQAAGETALVAVRTPAEAQAIAAELGGAGIEGAVIWTWPAQPALPEGRPACLLVAELHDARRHVGLLQRASRAGRAQQLLSLEDERTAASLEPWLVGAAKAMAGARAELPPRLAGLVARRAQRGAESLQAAMRMELASREQSLNDLLAFSGEGD
jgi:preprotein translocase subunit SecA